MGIGYVIDTPGISQGENLIGTAIPTGTKFTAAEMLKLINGRQSSIGQASAKTGIVLYYDLTAARNAQLFAMLGHGFTSGATLTLQADDDPAFGSPGVNLTLTWNDHQIIVYWSTPQSYRYWRILASDAANPNLPWIGELILGVPIFFTHPCAWGLAETFLFNNAVQASDYDVTWRFKKTERRAYQNINFTQRPDNEVAELTDLINYTDGSLIPIIMFLDEADPNQSIYGHLQDEFSRQFQFINWNNFMNVALTEQPRAAMIKVASF